MFAACLAPDDFAAAALAAVRRLSLTASVPFSFAHLARCAAAIRSLPAALMVLRVVANSSGLKLVVLFFDPLRRPRRFGPLESAEDEGTRLEALAEELPLPP